MELPHTGFNLSFHVIVSTWLKILLKFHDQLFWIVVTKNKQQKKLQATWNWDLVFQNPGCLGKWQPVFTNLKTDSDVAHLPLKNCSLRPPFPLEFIKYLRIRYAFIILDIRAISYTCPLLLLLNFITRKHTNNHFNSQVMREFWQAFLSSSRTPKGCYFPQLPRRGC